MYLSEKKQNKKNITFVYIQNVRAPLESSHEKISKALIRFQLIISGVNATGKNILENIFPPAFASLRRREIQLSHVARNVKLYMKSFIH